MTDLNLSRRTVIAGAGALAAARPPASGTGPALSNPCSRTARHPPMKDTLRLQLQRLVMRLAELDANLADPQVTTGWLRHFESAVAGYPGGAPAVWLEVADGAQVRTPARASGT